MITARVLALAMGLYVLMAVAAPAQPKIWVALVKADGVSMTEDPRLIELQPRLKSVFGFDSYHLLHEAEVPVGEKYAQWVLPRKDFYLKVEPLPKSASCIHYELYQDKKLLVEGKASPKPGRPVFILGPYYQDGRLIFLLRRMDDEKTKATPGK